MGKRIIEIRVEEPGTHEQHITHFKTDSNEVIVKQTMILLISLWNTEYYTFENGVKANLIVVTNSAGTQYVKSEPDDTTKNNLLSLPRF